MFRLRYIVNGLAIYGLYVLYCQSTQIIDVSVKFVKGFI
jgi:hypothetical protein